MEKNGTRIRYLLVLYILLAVYIVAMAVILGGRIRSNAEEAGFRAHAEAWLNKENMFSSTEVQCVLYSSKGPVATARTYVPGRKDELHYSLESLLSPISDEELRRGLISYIPEGTKLEGVSYRDGYAFVVLSEEFLSSTSVEKALEQIKMTLSLHKETESLYVYSGDQVFAR